MGEICYRWLDRDVYKGYSLNFTYETDRYYDVIAAESGISLEEKRFLQPVQKQFTDHLFSDWLEDPVAMGAFDDDLFVGVIEGSLETWHNVFRISNILVLGPYRSKHIGKSLMEKMLKFAHGIDQCRGVILETQSCNYPAITFYKKQGFLLNRIDLREYSNEDIQRKEVRLDFFLPFQSAEKEG